LNLQLPVPIEIAKSIKDDLRILAIVKLTGVEINYHHLEPKIDSPTDVHYYTYDLGQRIPALDVWIFNYRTGEILYKKNRDEPRMAAIAAEETRRQLAEKKKEEDEARKPWEAMRRKLDEGKKIEMIENEWIDNLTKASQYLKKDEVEEAAKLLYAIPTASNAWKLIGSGLMFEVWEKRKR
jgi:hypothetical protein